MWGVAVLEAALEWVLLQTCMCVGKQIKCWSINRASSIRPMFVIRYTRHACSSTSAVRYALTHLLPTHCVVVQTE